MRRNDCLRKKGPNCYQKRTDSVILLGAIHIILTLFMVGDECQFEPFLHVKSVIYRKGGVKKCL